MMTKREFAERFGKIFTQKTASAQVILLLYLVAKLLYELYFNGFLTDKQLLYILENKENG